MITNTDQDILNSDFLRWSNKMTESFEDQLRYIAACYEEQIKNTQIKTKNSLMSLNWPLQVALYCTFQDPIHKNLIPLTCPIYVTLPLNKEKYIKREAREAMSILMKRIEDTEFDYSAYIPVYGNGKDLQQDYTMTKDADRSR